MEAYLGEIKLMIGGIVPQNWIVCDGRPLSVQDNQYLFSLIGTIYGGNGVSTFAVPDLRGRIPVNQGTAKSGTQYQMAAAGGAATVAINAAEMPSHTHAMTVSTAAATTEVPTNNYLAAPKDQTTHAQAVSMYVPTTAAGYSVIKQNVNMIEPNIGGLDHDNVQPFQTVNYIICTSGYYPTFP